MAANKFEKNVQKTLDEFKLHPSEAVWQSVEKRIRKKSRRRIIFFIIFSFLGLMLAGYGVYHFSNRQKFTSEVRSRKLDKNRQGARNNEQDTTRIDNIQTRNLTVKTNSIKEIA